MTDQAGKKMEILHRQPGAVLSPEAHWDGVNPGISRFPAGYCKSPGHRAFAADTIFERDIEVPLRDGVVIRADVFRPVHVRDSGAVPALIAWSPYGKSGSGFMPLDIVQGRVGIPQSMLSGFESLEAPDPAEWTARGYAIVNVDARGVLGSDGDIRWWGSGEGRDGYDAIEHVALYGYTDWSRRPTSGGTVYSILVSVARYSRRRLLGSMNEQHRKSL